MQVAKETENLNIIQEENLLPENVQQINDETTTEVR